MSDGIFQKAMGFLQQPIKAFENEKKTDLTTAFTYMATLAIILVILSGVVSIITVPELGTAVLATIVMGYIGVLVGGVIVGLWVHLWAYIFGAKGGLNQTLKTIFYGGTPNYLLGWIPYIGPIFMIWDIILYYLGLKTLHGMPGDRAALTIIIAIVIPVIIITIAAAWLYLMLASYGGLGGEMFSPGMELPY